MIFTPGHRVAAPARNRAPGPETGEHSDGRAGPHAHLRLWTCRSRVAGERISQVLRHQGLLGARDAHAAPYAVLSSRGLVRAGGESETWSVSVV